MEWNSIKGKYFIFASVNDERISKIIESKGGVVLLRSSKNLNFVILKNEEEKRSKSLSSIKYAIQNKIAFITYEQFDQMFSPIQNKKENKRKKDIKNDATIRKDKEKAYKSMKVITWNVNGLKSLFTNPLYEASIKELVQNEDPDIFLFQETRCPVDLPIPEWFKAIYPFYEINAATSKKGYSGVGYFSKEKVIDCRNNVVDCLKDEGRSQLVHLCGKVKLLNLYVPNSKPDLARLDLRVTQWEPAVRDFLLKEKAKKEKGIIVAGDLNVTPSDADLYRKAKKMEHCNTPEERGAFATLLSTCDLVDTYRELRGGENKSDYTWFSNFGGARAKGNGWRIDFVLAPKGVVTEQRVLKGYVGSDHVPVVCQI